MNKYDWSNVPKEVKWIATDKWGWIWGYTEKPVSGKSSWHKGDCQCLIRDGGFGKPVKKWKDSLEERPNDH